MKTRKGIHPNCGMGHSVNGCYCDNGNPLPIKQLQHTKEESKMTTHTPTPWEVGNIINALHNVDDRTDANFIVRAVNSHEELLQASLKVQVLLEKLQGHIDPELERAIAKAEGK